MNASTVESLLSDLRGQGCTVAVVGNRLRVDAPVELTQGALASLETHKAGLIAALTSDAHSTPAAAPKPNLAEDGVWWSDPTSALMPEADNWLRQLRAAYAEIVYLPPRCCAFPRMCARLGGCNRRAKGGPCVVAP